MSSFYIVRHSFKLSSAAGWWAKMGEMQSNPEAFQAWAAKNAEAGFYNHAFLPTGIQSNPYCIWEVKEGISAADFQDFIDGPDGPSFGALQNECTQINTELAGQPPFPSYFAKSKATNDETETGEAPPSDSSLYLVHHTFLPGKAEGWWAGMAELMAAPEKFAAMQAAQVEAGFSGTFFAPTGKESDCFCLWEAAPGKSDSEMQAFIDGPLGPSNGAFLNVCIPIDLALAGGAKSIPRKFHNVQFMVNFKVQTGKRGELMKVLESEDGLPLAAGWDGCNHIECYTDPADADKVVIFAQWQSLSHQQAYMKMREETGFLAEHIKPLLAAAPEIKVLNRRKDGEARQYARGGADRHTVLARFEAKPETHAELLKVICNALPCTHAYKGNQMLKIFTDAEDPNAMLLLEQWDSEEDFKAYFQMRTETGFIDKIMPLLAGPPAPATLSFAWGLPVEAEPKKRGFLSRMLRRKSSKAGKKEELCIAPGDENTVTQHAVNPPVSPTTTA